jgi:hypothetical protein
MWSVALVSSVIPKLLALPFVTVLTEKLADRIRGRPSLPPSNAPYYQAPEWEARQR